MQQPPYNGYPPQQGYPQQGYPQQGYPQQWGHPQPYGANAYGHPGAPPGQRVFYMTLKKHTGMLVVMRTTTLRVQGTLEQCEAAYKDAQNHNLVAGWWGMFSFLFMNWIAIFGNMSAIAEVRKLAAAPPQLGR